MYPVLFKFFFFKLFLIIINDCLSSDYYTINFVSFLNLISVIFGYHNYQKNSDRRQAWANSVDPDQNAAPDQGLQSLRLIQQCLDTSTGNKTDLMKV